MTDKLDKLEAAVAAASNAVAQTAAIYGAVLVPVAEAAVGYRKILEEQYGYSPTMAEAIAAEYHRALLTTAINLINQSGKQ
jgi:hypothetical protein